MSGTWTITVSVFWKDFHDEWLCRSRFGWTDSAPEDPVFGANILGLKKTTWGSIERYQTYADMCSVWHYLAPTGSTATQTSRWLVDNHSGMQRSSISLHFSFAVAYFVADVSQTFQHHKAVAKWDGKKENQQTHWIPGVELHSTEFQVMKCNFAKKWNRHSAFACTQETVNLFFAF